MRPTIQRSTGGQSGWLAFFNPARVCAAALVALGAMLPGAQAQGSSDGAADPVVVTHNRFLFVVDTSSGMKKFSADTQKAVENVIRTAADGQLHAGDTLGVWTFNKDVYTGRMPLQTWSLGDSEEIAMRMGEYLREQPLEYDSHMEQAMSAIGKVVKLSDIITVILISDGKNPITGTPFDAEINQAYVQNLATGKKNAKPVVTVLEGRNGKFLKRYTVTSVEWPVVIPDLPMATKSTRSPSETTGEAMAKAAPAKAPPGPSMILMGPQPSDFPIQSATSTGSQPAAPAVAPPAPAPVPAPAAAPVATASAPAAPTAPTIPTETAAPAPTPAPAPAAPVVIAQPPVAPTVSATAPVVSAPVAPPAAPEPTPTPAATPISTPETTPTVTTARPMSPENYVNPGHPFIPPPPAASQPPVAPEPAPSTGSVGTPAVAVAATPTPARVAPAAPAAVVEVSGEEATKAAAVKPATVAAAKPVVVAQSPGMIRSLVGDHQMILLVGGIVLVLAAVGLVIIMTRRPAARVSIISQTMGKPTR